MTAVDAKSALVKLLEQTDDTELSRFLDRLKEAEPTMVQTDVAEMGPWKCYLSKKCFTYTIDAHPNAFLEYAGDFEKSPDGKWVAKVTSKTQM